MTHILCFRDYPVAKDDCRKSGVYLFGINTIVYFRSSMSELSAIAETSRQRYLPVYLSFQFHGSPRIVLLEYNCISVLSCFSFLTSSSKKQREEYIACADRIRSGIIRSSDPSAQLLIRGYKSTAYFSMAALLDNPNDHNV